MIGHSLCRHSLWTSLLSVFYCSKACQKLDYKNHKHVCLKLKQQRLKAVQNDINVIAPMGISNIPYLGIVLPESVTGTSGEVLCDIPAGSSNRGAEVDFGRITP